MTVDAVVSRPATLEQQFPEYQDVLAFAGAPPTARQLAEHWQRTAELQERLENLRAKIKTAKRR